LGGRGIVNVTGGGGGEVYHESPGFGILKNNAVEPRNIVPTGEGLGEQVKLRGKISRHKACYMQASLW